MVDEYVIMQDLSAGLGVATSHSSVPDISSFQLEDHLDVPTDQQVEVASVQPAVTEDDSKSPQEQQDPGDPLQVSVAEDHDSVFGQWLTLAGSGVGGSAWVEPNTGPGFQWRWFVPRDCLDLYLPYALCDMPSSPRKLQRSDRRFVGDRKRPVGNESGNRTG